jgi:AcrR family transcriptional regulator
MSRKRQPASSPAPEDAVRKRIQDAAFGVLMKRGYARTNTLEIATRAKVSKRELYALFRDKQAILTSCIAERAKEVQMPLDFPSVRDRETLARVLKTFGVAALRTLSHPSVTAVFRLAILEAERSPEVARALDTAGRGATREAFMKFLAQAQSAGLLGSSDPSLVAEQFFALLWGGLRVRLLLQLAPQPGKEEIEKRAQLATDAVLLLHGGKERQAHRSAGRVNLARQENVGRRRPLANVGG